MLNQQLLPSIDRLSPTQKNEVQSIADRAERGQMTRLDEKKLETLLRSAMGGRDVQ